MGDPFEPQELDPAIPMATKLLLERALLSAIELEDEELAGEHVLVALTEKSDSFAWQLGEGELDPSPVRDALVAVTDDAARLEAATPSNSPAGGQAHPAPARARARALARRARPAPAQAVGLGRLRDTWEALVAGQRPVLHRPRRPSDRSTVSPTRKAGRCSTPRARGASSFLSRSPRGPECGPIRGSSGLAHRCTPVGRALPWSGVDTCPARVAGVDGAVDPRPADRGDVICRRAAQAAAASSSSAGPASTIV